MKLNNKLQYGILLALYLSRSGRADLEDVANGLHVKKYFLQIIANKLTKAKILNYKKNEGYELVADTKFIELFNTLDRVEFLKNHEFVSHPSVERRALSLYSIKIGMSLNPLLNKTIKEVMQAQIAAEVHVLNNVNKEGVTN